MQYMPLTFLSFGMKYWSDQLLQVSSVDSFFIKMEDGINICVWL